MPFNDPASLPTRDGKPVRPGDELKAETCNTCLYCRLKVFNDKPGSYCGMDCPPSQTALLFINLYPISPTDPSCARWILRCDTYIDRFRGYWHQKRLENDFDCQMERKKELEAEAQDNAESLREDRARGIFPRIPKLGGRYGRS